MTPARGGLPSLRRVPLAFTAPGAAPTNHRSCGSTPGRASQPLISMFLRHRQGRTALHVAAKYGNADFIEAILAREPGILEAQMSEQVCYIPASRVSPLASQYRNTVGADLAIFPRVARWCDSLLLSLPPVWLRHGAPRLGDVPASPHLRAFDRRRRRDRCARTGAVALRAVSARKHRLTMADGCSRLLLPGFSQKLSSPRPSSAR